MVKTKRWYLSLLKWFSYLSSCMKSFARISDLAKLDHACKSTDRHPWRLLSCSAVLYWLELSAHCLTLFTTAWSFAKKYCCLQCFLFSGKKRIEFVWFLSSMTLNFSELSYYSGAECNRYWISTDYYSHHPCWSLRCSWGLGLNLLLFSSCTFTSWIKV